MSDSPCFFQKGELSGPRLHYEGFSFSLIDMAWTPALSWLGLNDFLTQSWLHLVSSSELCKCIVIIVWTWDLFEVNLDGSDAKNKANM